jgi:hypothetical protein
MMEWHSARVGVFAILLLGSFWIYGPDCTLASNWARTYRASDESTGAWEVRQTSDGGFVMTASLCDPPGLFHCYPWILKLSCKGDVQWSRSYRAVRSFVAFRIRETSDGGFAVAGATGPEAWVLKLDVLGTIQWEKSYGCELDSCAAYGQWIEETTDGGLILAADRMLEPTNRDFWILKLSALGAVQWEAAFGGPSGDYVRTVKETADGGFFVVGETYSYGAGEEDVWILRLDASGAVRWQRTYGGHLPEYFESAEMTRDGGLVMLAAPISFPGGDVWVFRLDPQGDVLWEKAYGGSATLGASAIVETRDGSLVLAGRYWDSVPDERGFWISKLDVLGDLQWEEAYEGFDQRLVSSIRESWDGGLVVAAGEDDLISSELGVAIYKLDVGGRIAPACSLPVNTIGEVLDTWATVRETDAVATVTAAVVSEANPIVLDEPIVVDVLCEDPSCTPLACDGITVEPDPVCDGESMTLAADITGGECLVAVEWDFDGDTLTDAVGNPVTATLPVGSWDVSATVTDSCADPAPQGCSVSGTATVSSEALPGEVSAVRLGEPPLLVAREAGRVTVEREAGATAYNVYTDSLGSWYAPSVAKGTVCSIGAWTDNGDGTVTLDYNAPGNSWLLVTASKGCGEGPAGTDSAGTERSGVGRWQFCGAAP